MPEYYNNHLMAPIHKFKDGSMRMDVFVDGPNVKIMEIPLTKKLLKKIQVLAHNDLNLWYTWLNLQPNLRGGVGFSDIVVGFEPYLNNENVEELKKKYPVLMFMKE